MDRGKPGSIFQKKEAGCHDTAAVRVCMPCTDHRIGEQFFLSGRAGAVYLGSEEETCISGACAVEEKDPELSFSYGIAAGLQLSSGFGLQLQWTVLNVDVLHTGLMLEWRF